MIAGYPPGLEAVVQRALERDPARRFATALEMARALENWLASTALPAGTGEVGDFVQVLFAEQMAFREALLRRSNTGSGVERIDAWGGSGREVPSVSRSDAAPGGPGPTPASVPPPRRVRPRERRSLRAAAVALLALAALGSGYVLRGQSGPAQRGLGHVAAQQTPPGPAARPEAAPVTPTAVTAPVEPTVAAPAAPVEEAPVPPAPVVEEAPAAGSAAGSTARPRAVRGARGTRPASAPRGAEVEGPEPGVATPPTGRMGYLTLTSRPLAEVFEGTRSLGSTPLVDRLMPAGHHELRLVPRDGSAPRTISVDVEAGATSMARISWE